MNQELCGLIPVLEVLQLGPATGYTIQDPDYTYDAIRARCGADYTLIQGSVLVVTRSHSRRSPTYTVLALYITSETDAAVERISRLVPANVQGMSKYYPTKESIKFYKGMRPVKDGASAVSSYLKRPAYAGRNFYDGIGFFAGRNGSGMEILYSKRKPAALDDQSFVTNHAMTYSGVFALEQKYVPAVANMRRRLAETSGSPGAIPGLPPDLLPANAVACSIGFACDAHNDSGRNGMTESILWNAVVGTPPSSGRYAFVMVEARVLVDLQCAPGSFMAIRSDTTHGSVLPNLPAPMTAKEAVELKHELVGCVIMTKKQTSSNTATMNAALSRLRDAVWHGTPGDALYGGIQV